MTQELGYPKAGVEGANASVHQLLPGAGGIAVPQAVVSHGPGGVRVLDFGANLVDVLLEPAYRVMGRYVVRHEQLVAPGRDGQELLEFDTDALVDGHGAELAALAFDGDGVSPEGLLRDGRVDAEALMDAQPGIPGQAGDGGKVLASIGHRGDEEQVELPDAPGAVFLAEAAVLELHRQFVIFRQAVFGLPHHVVVKADGGQIEIGRASCRERV